MSDKTVDSTFLQTLKYRCIGPTRGGRVVAVAADYHNPAVFYFGAVAGGVWKTDDGGQYWQCVTDGQLNTSSIGALAVAQSDSNVIYAGTGETSIRIDVTHGDGIYKSTDAGKSWKHMGLSETRHIGEIRIHPEDENLVYVAALGHAFKDNPERGVYRSKDGGETWEPVLSVSDKAGAVDLAMDPNNPRILFAAVWQARRKFWSIESGGPDSGLWRSMDGGDSWENLNKQKGMPEGDLGKIGVTISPAQSGRVWAIIEAEGDKRGLFRSDDYGETWEKVSSNRKIQWRPWYFSHIFAHPTEPDSVYAFNIKAWKSTDGGKNFNELTTPHGDNHDLWIDPQNPQRMIGGDDGGAWVSFNGGRSWSTIYNQPTAQFYHVTVDNQYPYRVYGTQQDNSSISVPSRTGGGAITWPDCYPAGTGESGYIAVDPRDSNIVYVGAVGSSPGGGDCLQRYDHRTKQVQLVTIWPEEDIMAGDEAKYRFQWTYPIMFSHHNPNVLYATGNVVFRTENGGQSWEPISPDLTHADPETIKTPGGPLTHDTAGAEMYATIFAFAESKHQEGVMWTGSDDGLVHFTRDNGEEWVDITPEGMPKFTQITMLEPSAHDAGTIYMTAIRHKMGDYAPYVYKSNDYGKTWQTITNGIPENDFVRVIREDPKRQGLLYAGTELGIYVSFDDGANWQSLQGNLPVTPVYDLVIKDDDLVVATHGRSFWILDDLTPLHQLTDELLTADQYLLAPRDTVRFPKGIGADWFGGEAGKNYNVGFGTAAAYLQKKNELGEIERTFFDAGEDAPYGVAIHYYFKEAPKNEVKLEILTAAGEPVHSFTSTIPEKKEEREGEQYVSKKAGMNRFLWDMHYAKGTKVEGSKIYKAPAGPLAPPGAYQVRLTVGDWSMTRPFNLLADPRVNTSAEDFAKQFKLLKEIQDKVSDVYQAVNRIQDAKAQIEGWVKRLSSHEQAEKVKAEGESLKEKLSAVETALINPDFVEGDALNKPMKLSAKLQSLPSVVGSADTAPTQQSYEVFDKLSTEADEQLNKLQEIIATDVAAFNQLLVELSVPAVVI